MEIIQILILSATKSVGSDQGNISHSKKRYKKDTTLKYKKRYKKNSTFSCEFGTRKYKKDMAKYKKRYGFRYKKGTFTSANMSKSLKNTKKIDLEAETY